MVQLDELERQQRFQCVDHFTGATVAGVDHQLQRLECAGIDVAEQVGDVTCAVLQRVVAALNLGIDKLATLGQPFDLEQAGVAADWPGVVAHQLHAVVILGIVAGRDHDAAIELVVEGGKVDLLGAALADVIDIDPALAQAAHHLGGHLRTGEADVVPDHHLAWLEVGREGAADAPGDLVIELVGDAAADVVGLEAAVVLGHAIFLHGCSDQMSR